MKSFTTLTHPLNLVVYAAFENDIESQISHFSSEYLNREFWGMQSLVNLIVWPRHTC